MAFASTVGSILDDFSMVATGSPRLFIDGQAVGRVGDITTALLPLVDGGTRLFVDGVAVSLVGNRDSDMHAIVGTQVRVDVS